MSCAECGERIRRNEAAWLLPGWPNRWRTQAPLPFHRDCLATMREAAR